mgnify:CR=1 FL=1
MSAKSRKRNKRLLALAGLAGAVAMSKNKRNASIDKGIKSAEDDKGSEMLSKKTDYITKKDTTPKDTNKGSGSNVRTRQRIVDSSGNTVESAGVKSKDVKGILPPSQNKGNMYAGVGDTNPRSRGYGKKDGGRAEYKSGGKVKGCGKALRGFGKAMKGNR